MSERINNEILDEALRRLAKQFDWHCDVEILLVGGAAGMVTGLLPPERTTIDCDVIHYFPEQAWAAVERTAELVGRELGLSPHWLNSHVQIRSDCLPDGWKSRRIFVVSHGRLLIYAISRIDLIAMKFIAHRAQDLEDLLALKVTEEDRVFVQQYLKQLKKKGTTAKEIEEAGIYLENWEVCK